MSLLKICFVSKNFYTTKVHVMSVFVAMTCHPGVVVKQREGLFVFRNLRLQLSFCSQFVQLSLHTMPDWGRSASFCAFGDGRSKPLFTWFTSIPVDLALTIPRERLQQDKNLKDRKNMSDSNIMTLLGWNDWDTVKPVLSGRLWDPV